MQQIQQQRQRRQASRTAPPTAAPMMRPRLSLESDDAVPLTAAALSTISHTESEKVMRHEHWTLHINKLEKKALIM